jgi:hypothetical protein|tara:strand:- start:5761 stop:6072 length:312 start_codon:yes stop_codon:yes gene_type:complete
MEHTWNVEDLNRNTLTGLVTEVTYLCSSKHEWASAAKLESISLPSINPTDESFVEFEDLTRELTLSWVLNSLDTSSIETSNSASIALQHAKVLLITSSNGTPW